MKTKILLLITLILSINTACRKKPENPYGNKLGELDVKADPVKTEAELIRSGSFPLELVSNGKLQASSGASLYFTRNGLITRINVRTGDWVEAGDVIAELDSREAGLALQQSRISLERASVELRSLIIGHTGRSAREEDVDPVAMESMKLKSGYNDALVNLEMRELAYNECFLKAPFSGRITDLKVKAHNPPPSGAPFCRLLDDREFEVVFQVLESEWQDLHQGQQVIIRPFVNEQEFEGEITEINPLVNEHSLVSVKARVKNRNLALVEGMNVKVFIRFHKEGGLIIPKSALVLRNNRQVVFSVKNGRSYWNYVETGFENSSAYTISILSGVLTQGDTIITRGNLNLAHDTEIEIQFKDNSERLW